MSALEKESLLLPWPLRNLESEMVTVGTPVDTYTAPRIYRTILFLFLFFYS